MGTKKKPVPGHRCIGLTLWVLVGCECGWRSDQLRASERATVYAQWRDHVAHCVEAAEDAELEAALATR